MYPAGPALLAAVLRPPTSIRFVRKGTDYAAEGGPERIMHGGDVSCFVYYFAH
jgi:hypothetical protein